MRAWQETLEDRKSNFEPRIREEVAAFAKANRRLKRDLAKQQRELGPPPSKEEIRAKVRSRYRSKLASARRECAAREALRESENASLSAELGRLKQERASAAEAESTHQRELEHLSAAHASLESELAQRLADARAGRASRGEVLRAELAAAKARADAADAQCARRLKTEEGRRHKALIAREAAIAQAKAAHVREREQIEAEHQNAVAALRTGVAELEGELAQVAAAHEQARRALEVELRAVRGQVIADPLAATSPSPRRRHGQRTPEVPLPDIGEVSARMERRSCKLCDGLARRRTECDARAREHRVALRELAAAVEKEKAALAAEVGQAEEQLGAVFGGGGESGEEPRVAELRTKAEEQQKAIAQLRGEAERARVEIPRRKALLALQVKQEKRIAEIQNTIRRVRGQCPEALRQAVGEGATRLTEVSSKNEEKIQDALKKLILVYETTISLHKKLETANLINFHKWREIRTDIGGSIPPCPEPRVQQVNLTPAARVVERMALPPLRNA
jgi:hypothetical protein